VKSGRQKGGQALSERVDEQMRRRLSAGTQMQHRQKLGARIDGQPQPEHLSGTAEPGAQFVQLEVRDMQVAEGVLMEELSVLACASEPPCDGRLPITEDAFSRGRVQPFSQGGEHHDDLVRGSFQTVQRSVASSTERGAALLAAKGLDLLSLTMLAIPNQRVDPRIGDAEVHALLIGTGKILGIDAFGRSPTTFDLAPGAHRSRR